MKKTVVAENERALLFRNGRFVKLLGPGRYVLCGGSAAELCPLDKELCSGLAPLDRLLECPEIASAVTEISVEDAHLALHFVNGLFKDALTAGRHAFWNQGQKHEFTVVDTAYPEVAPEIPRHIFPKLSPRLFQQIDIEDYQKGLLFFDKRFERELGPGSYFFWRGPVTVGCMIFDTRRQQMNVSGQEIMTADKVALRINFVLSYKVTDFLRAATEIADQKEQLHVAAQLALRDYVGRYHLDEVLAGKDQMGEYVTGVLKSKEKELCVEILEAGVKDVILPGEIADIMNTVLVAEKQAQANVITRREEVASTRSLLNTARLMEENQTLYRLKELEYVQKICENVGSINLNGGGDALEQLLGLLAGKSK